jgi:Tol biopolymer transport system component
VTLAVAALTGLAAYIIAGRRHAPPVPGTPGIDGTAASAFRLVASAAGRKTTVSLSADGQRMAYASDVDGDWDIYLQVAAGGAPSNLTAGSPRVEFAPALSPDGRALAYVVAGKPSEIHVMDLLSGVSRLIVEHEASDLSWSPDGREILFTDSIYGGPRSGAAPTKLLAVDAATGRLRSLTGIYGAQASASSTGAVTFVGMGDGRMDIWMLPAGGGDAVRITDDMAAYWSPVWSRSGDAIYFGSDRLGGGALFRVAVDPLAGRALGEPVALSPAVFPGQFYLARGGDEDTALALLTTRHPGHLYRLSLAIDRPDAAPRVEPIPGRFLAARSPDVAPDGRSLAYTAVTSQEDLAVSAIDGTQARLLTQDAFRDRAPRWAPDGSRIAFHSDRSGQMEIWTITPDGSELTQHTRSVSAATRPSWSPDGRRLAYSVEGLGTFVIPVERDLAGGDAATAIGPLADGSGPFEAFAWSPDGDFLAGVARGIVIYAFGDGTFQRLTDHGTSPVWLDAQRILFSTQREIHLVDRRSGESMPLFALAPASIEPSLGIAPDGSSLYVGLSTSAEELWHVELKD